MSMSITVEEGKVTTEGTTETGSAVEGTLGSSVKVLPKFELVKGTDGNMEAHMQLGGQDTGSSSNYPDIFNVAVMGTIPEPTGTYSMMEVMIQYNQDNDIPYSSVLGVGLEDWKQGQIKEIRDMMGKLVATKLISRVLFFPDTNSMLECPLAKRDNGKRFIYAYRSAVRLIDNVNIVNMDNDRQLAKYLGTFFYQLSDVA